MTRRPLKQNLQWSDADDAALRELADRGFSVFAIAKQLRRHETTITKRISLLKLAVKGKPRS